jgi:hypothetical protein
MFAALAAVIAYLVTARLKPMTRIVIALLVLVVPCAGLTALVVAVGDKAPPDAVAVTFQ